MKPICSPQFFQRKYINRFVFCTFLCYSKQRGDEHHLKRTQSQGEAALGPKAIAVPRPPARSELHSGRKVTSPQGMSHPTEEQSHTSRQVLTRSHPARSGPLHSGAVAFGLGTGPRGTRTLPRQE